MRQYSQANNMATKRRFKEGKETEQVRGLLHKEKGGKGL